MIWCYYVIKQQVFQKEENVIVSFNNCKWRIFDVIKNNGLVFQYVHISPVKRSVNRIMTLETQLENIKSKGFLYYLYLSPETSFELIGLGYRLRCINASWMINKTLNGFSESNLPDKLNDSDHPFYFGEMIKGNSHRLMGYFSFTIRKIVCYCKTSIMLGSLVLLFIVLMKSLFTVST